jgi:hypothetical protein
MHEESMRGGRRICMVTRIPKLIAEINTIIADHSNNDLVEEQEAIDLLKRARHALNLARVKLQEADLKSAPTGGDPTGGNPTRSR